MAAGRKPPNLARRAASVAIATAKHAAGGFKYRSKERVIELFNNHCIACDDYIPSMYPSSGGCVNCGCPVNGSIKAINKLKIATESCPLGFFSEESNKEDG